MIPFVGGSNQLRRKKADTQRTVNMHTSFIESGDGKANARMFLKSIPGLRSFSVPPPPPPPPTPGAFNPEALSDPTFWVLSNENRTGVFTDPSGSPGLYGNHNVRSLQGHTDKRYFEFVWADENGVGGQLIVGLGEAEFPSTAKVGYNILEGGTYGVGYDNLGNALENGGFVAALPTYALGDVVMMAVDASNGHVWYGKNGTWNGDPAAGAGYSSTAPVGTLYAMVGGDNVNFTGSPMILYAGTGNFTAETQVYPAPSGFTPWDD